MQKTFNQKPVDQVEGKIDDGKIIVPISDYTEFLAVQAGEIANKKARDRAIVWFGALAVLIGGGGAFFLPGLIADSLGKSEFFRKGVAAAVGENTSQDIENIKTEVFSRLSLARLRDLLNDAKDGSKEIDYALLVEHFEKAAEFEALHTETEFMSAMREFVREVYYHDRDDSGSRRYMDRVDDIAAKLMEKPETFDVVIGDETRTESLARTLLYLISFYGDHKLGDPEPSANVNDRFEANKDRAENMGISFLSLPYVIALKLSEVGDKKSYASDRYVEQYGDLNYAQQQWFLRIKAAAIKDGKQSSALSYVRQAGKRMELIDTLYGERIEELTKPPEPKGGETGQAQSVSILTPDQNTAPVKIRNFN